jgi:hypothetical protein
LLSGVARHPKDLSISHPASGNAMWAHGCFEPVLKIKRTAVQFSGRCEWLRKTFTEKSLRDVGQLHHALT